MRKKKSDGMSLVLHIPLTLRTIIAAQGKAEGLASRERLIANLKEILYFHPLDRRVSHKVSTSPDPTHAFHL